MSGRRNRREAETDGTGMRGDERSHARLLRELSTQGGREGGALARLEGRHRTIGGNALRAAVLGANDGIVSNLSLVRGCRRCLALEPLDPSDRHRWPARGLGLDGDG